MNVSPSPAQDLAAAERYRSEPRGVSGHPAARDRRHPPAASAFTGGAPGDPAPGAGWTRTQRAWAATVLEELRSAGLSIEVVRPGSDAEMHEERESMP